MSDLFRVQYLKCGPWRNLKISLLISFHVKRTNRASVRFVFEYFRTNFCDSWYVVFPFIEYSTTSLWVIFSKPY